MQQHYRYVWMSMRCHIGHILLTLFRFCMYLYFYDICVLCLNEVNEKNRKFYSHIKQYKNTIGYSYILHV